MLARIAFGLTLLMVTMGHDHGCCTSTGTPSGATCPPGSTLTYDSFGSAFMASYCTACHSSQLHGAQARHTAPPDHDFDAPAGIQDALDHIDEQAAAGPAATNHLMPPLGWPAPSADERALLGEWIACGAP